MFCRDVWGFGEPCVIIEALMKGNRAKTRCFLSSVSLKADAHANNIEGFLSNKHFRVRSVARIFVDGLFLALIRQNRRLLKRNFCASGRNFDNVAVSYRNHEESFNKGSSFFA